MSAGEQVNAAQARRSLRNGFIALALGLALAAGLLLGVPGLQGRGEHGRRALRRAVRVRRLALGL